MGEMLYWVDRVDVVFTKVERLCRELGRSKKCEEAWKDLEKEHGLSSMHNTCSLSASCEHTMTKMSS